MADGSSVTISFRNGYLIPENARNAHAAAIGSHIADVGLTPEELETLTISIDGQTFEFMSAIRKEIENPTPFLNIGNADIVIVVVE